MDPDKWLHSSQGNLDVRGPDCVGPGDGGAPGLGAPLLPGPGLLPLASALLQAETPRIPAVVVQLISTLIDSVEYTAKKCKQENASSVKKTFY